MTANGWFQLVFYTLMLLVLALPLGWYMARVYEGRPFGLDRALGWLEPLIYRIAGVRKDAEMNWKQYALAVLLFHGLGVLFGYVLLRLQAFHPLNPAGMSTVAPDGAFNTAVSFVTNTNWQWYGGESTMSYFSQMAFLTVQNFVSAATGMAVLVALIRGITRRTTQVIGNFWVDLTRSTLYVLLPLAIVMSLLLVSQGVVQTLSPYTTASLLDPVTGADGTAVTEQVIAVGPAASQVAIKHLGTNGGGFFNANSAHPLENPTPFSNLLVMLGHLLIPAALCITFGRMVRDRRQGWAVLAAMTIIFVGMLIPLAAIEGAGNPLLAHMGIEQMGAGNMEGKEVRFGIAATSWFATATTAASCGAVNAMHDSFMPLGGLIPIVLMQLGEVVYGGVGSGLYGMLMFVVVAVFVAGLMVGRTPEYLGKKIEAHEMKMASIAILAPPFITLLMTAIAVAMADGVDAMQDGGAHGFSEALYAFTSQGNNNGSAFAGYAAGVPLLNLLGGLAMLVARFWTLVPILALAGSLAEKKYVPVSSGTLPTYGPLFVVLLVSVVLVVGALTFSPALALGPIVEHLQLWAAA